jgi:pilus assembly protein CpaB
MDKKKLMLLIGAAVVAIGTALAARSLLSGASTQPVVAAVMPSLPQGPQVLVAVKALPVGTIITPDAVSFQPWPRNLIQDAYFLDGKVDKAKLIGTVVRYQVTAGQPLTQGALVAPGDRGFLAAALGPGMRAITIPVSDMTGVAGFIFPGDHVDLMLTQSVAGSGAGGDTQALKATETILRNLRVLATDQTTDTTTENGKTVVRKTNNVTMEVTPRIAEKIEVAQTIGTLSLALRSLADNQTELEHAIASGTVKLPDNATKADEDKLIAAGANRPVEGATTFSTGGDVSRFQRRSMPAMGGGLPAGPSAPGAPAGAFVTGPSVKVVRGNAETVVPVSAGARRNAGAASRSAGGE